MVCVGWVGGLEALIFHELGVEMVCVGWVGGLSTLIFHELGVEMVCSRISVAILVPGDAPVYNLCSFSAPVFLPGYGKPP